MLFYAQIKASQLGTSETSRDPGTAPGQLGVEVHIQVSLAFVGQSCYPPTGIALLLGQSIWEDHAAPSAKMSSLGWGLLLYPGTTNGAHARLVDVLKLPRFREINSQRDRVEGFPIERNTSTNGNTMPQGYLSRTAGLAESFWLASKILIGKVNVG
jgi:hypothetical protein